jgi:chromosome segregation ATPase
MNNRLKYVNLLGVTVLAALCVAQWVHDRRLNLEIKRLYQVRLQQSARIDDQANQLRGLNEDLNQLKASLATERDLRSQAEKKLAASEVADEQLTRERDQLKAAISNWANAVALRDERMKEANARIEQLAADLNASIRKYNELVTNYNAVVKSLGATRGQTGKSD